MSSLGDSPLWTPPAVKVSGCNEHLFRQQTIRLLHALFWQKF